jgi:hypothetical protein
MVQAAKSLVRLHRCCQMDKCCTLLFSESYVALLLVSDQWFVYLIALVLVSNQWFVCLIAQVLVSDQ